MTITGKAQTIAAAAAVWALALLPSGAAAAGNCIAGGCHKAIVAAKFVHGPVAAEGAGGVGCASCHVPAGAPCTAKKAGVFQFKTKVERLCLLCHERETATQHTRTRGNCLSCHSPHGSDQSYKLLRAGK